MTAEMTTQPQIIVSPRSRRLKPLIGGLMLLAAVVYLVISSTTQNAEFFLTVEELQAQAATLGQRQVRVSGAVVPDSIQYNPETMELTFTIANMPGSQKEIDAAGGLAAALRAAVNDPTAARLQVHYVGPKPDLLRPEASAILAGRLQPDGVFHATEVLFKCPTRYEEAPAAPDGSAEG